MNHHCRRFCMLCQAKVATILGFSVTNTLLPPEFGAIENYINTNPLPRYCTGRGTRLGRRPGLQTSGFFVTVIFGAQDSILSRGTPRRAHRWVSPGAMPEPPDGHGYLGGIGTDPFPTFFVCCAYPLNDAHNVYSVLVISMKCDGVPR